MLYAASGEELNPKLIKIEEIEIPEGRDSMDGVLLCKQTGNSSF